MSANKLIENISQLREVAADVLHAMEGEVSSANIPYETVYREFQSGGWQTALLYTPEGGHRDGTVRDGAAIPTELVRKLPAIYKFLENLGLDYFTVRIARNGPDSWLWEHQDYNELDAQKSRLRLHVPLSSSPRALFHFDDSAICMASGWVWKLNPTASHAISNTGLEPRTHLILDCYVNQRLREMLNNEILQQHRVQRLPHLTPEERRDLIHQAGILLAQRGMKEAEEYLLKTFHKFDLGEGTSYDLVIEFYKRIGFRSREDHWISAYFSRLHHHAEVHVHETMESLHTTVFSNLHNLSVLPQFEILQSVSQTCRRYSGLEQLFVRGSLARGDFDLDSDVDLLCVVAAPEYLNFIEKVDSDIQEHHGALMERWVDTIVKDFGGIGFVYLLQTEKGPFQLDLYVSCSGHPSLARLAAVPHKREIFRQIPDESPTKAYLDELRYRLHSKEIKRYISGLHSLEPSASRLVTELNILGFMIAKCLGRGNIFVALSEYLMWQRCFIKLVRSKFDKPHIEYGFYHLKRLMAQPGESGHLYEALRAICDHPLSIQNFREAHRFAMRFALQHFPDDYNRLKEMIQSVTQCIEGHRIGSLASHLSPWPNDALHLLKPT
ncbi:hypothetical protein MKX08_003913 [Trichoderma sp. CBMAI-0020]|nr:hypothetical protein MKX08_003913 [Trichoderma sp. CBMAI-0020]